MDARRRHRSDRSDRRAATPARRKRRLHLTLGLCLAAIVAGVAAVLVIPRVGGDGASGARARTPAVLVGHAAFRWQPDAPARPDAPLPAFAAKDPEIASLYRFALERPDLLNSIPCMCGCRSTGHRSNWNCYVRQVRPDGTVVFDDMAPG